MSYVSTIIRERGWGEAETRRSGSITKPFRLLY
jgi:hypothetical protein